MLGQDDGQSQVLVEAADGDEHLLGRLRIELRGRLVQHQHFGVQRQHGRDGDPLLLAAGKGADVAVTQMRDRQLVQHFLDTLAHQRRRQGLVFHAEGQFVLDPLGDKL